MVLHNNAEQLFLSHPSSMLAFPRSFDGLKAAACRHLATFPQVDDLYDVVIVGGGLVGSAVAAALSMQLSVAVLRPPSLRDNNKPEFCGHMQAATSGQKVSELLSSTGRYCRGSQDAAQTKHTSILTGKHVFTWAAMQAPPQESAALDAVPGIRVSTISPSSVELLKEICDWQDIAPPRSAPFSAMQVTAIVTPIIAFAAYLSSLPRRSYFTAPDL